MCRTLLASFLLLALPGGAVPVVRRTASQNTMVTVAPDGASKVVRRTANQNTLVAVSPDGVPNVVVRRVNDANTEAAPQAPTAHTTEQAHLSLQQVMTCPNYSPVSQTQCLSETQYDQIVDAITTIMHDLKTSFPCGNNTCLLADFAGCTLRAAGHDFMDFRNGVGGSDGCLRFDDPDNKGLINCLRGDFDLNGDTDPDMFNKTLHDVYINFCDVVSLADFLVIAGEAAMGFTATSTTVNLRQIFKDEFMYSRTTTQTCPNNVDLPNPFDGCAANEVTFLAQNALDFSWRETAALMGVHTLGKTSLANSGYSGWWQDEHNVARFNNNYYISIVNHGWGPAVKSSGKSQWDRIDSMDEGGRSHPELMLNTDMCLVYSDVRAESSNCCAWERFGELIRLNVRENTTDEDNVEIYCGFKHPFESSFGTERSWCCKSNPLDNTPSPVAECAPAVPGPANMDGDNLVTVGPATHAVHDFASNEDLWLGEFVAVWKAATGKGFGSLRVLEQSCGPPTQVPTSAPAPISAEACQVTVYEHWPEGITAGLSGLEVAEHAWSGRFPTGASMVLNGIGVHGLGALSNLVSSVKVKGACCKAYGFSSADCSGTQGNPIEATTQLLQSLPAGVVTPATGLKSVWGCNDCAQCVKVEQDCSTL